MNNFKLFPTDYCPFCHEKLLEWINPDHKDYIVYYCPTKVNYFTHHNWGHYAFDLKQAGFMVQFSQCKLDCFIANNCRVFSNKDFDQYPLIAPVMRFSLDDLNVEIDKLEQHLQTLINFS